MNKSDRFKTPEERDAYSRGYADGRSDALEALPRVMAEEHPDPCHCDFCPVVKKVLETYWERIASSTLDVDRRFWEVVKDWVSIRMGGVGNP